MWSHLLHGHRQQERHIALLPLEEVEYFRKNKRTMTKQEYGVWVADNRYGVKRSPFLVLGSKDTIPKLT
jgi:hypothetical protein